MAGQFKPNGDNETFAELPNFAEAAKIVGGFVEVVNLKNGLQMLVNEDGHSIGLDYNAAASNLYGGIIVGNAIVGTRREIEKICSR